MRFRLNLPKVIWLAILLSSMLILLIHIPIHCLDLSLILPLHLKWELQISHWFSHPRAVAFEDFIDQILLFSVLKLLIFILFNLFCVEADFIQIFNILEDFVLFDGWLLAFHIPCPSPLWKTINLGLRILRWMSTWWFWFMCIFSLNWYRDFGFGLLPWLSVCGTVVTWISPCWHLTSLSCFLTILLLHPKLLVIFLHP